MGWALEHADEVSVRSLGEYIYEGGGVHILDSVQEPGEPKLSTSSSKFPHQPAEGHSPYCPLTALAPGSNMHFPQIALFGLVGVGAVHAAAVLDKRTAAQVESDIATVSADLASFDNAIQSFTGSLLQALSLLSAYNTLSSAVEAATAEVTSTGTLASGDSATIYAAVDSLTAQISTTLGDVTDKVCMPCDIHNPTLHSIIDGCAVVSFSSSPFGVVRAGLLRPPAGPAGASQYMCDTKSLGINPRSTRSSSRLAILAQCALLSRPFTYVTRQTRFPFPRPIP